MAGLKDTPEGGETRRYGDTVGVPHGETDGTALADATVQPGDVVGIDGSGNLALADSNAGVEALGVLVNYAVYGASHRGELIQGDVDATVAVQGTRSAKATTDALSAGDLAGTPDSSLAGEEAGEFTSGSDFRVVAVDGSPSGYDMVEVVL